MPAAQSQPSDQQSDNLQLQVVPDAKTPKPNAIRALRSQANKRELIAHALAFERAAFDMLEEFKAARKFEGGACVPDALREEAANARKADAACLFSMTKAWDSALERHRVLKGSPLPGSRRPTDPLPKAIKPKNRPPS